MHPSVREMLSGYLLKRQDDVLERLMAHLGQAADMGQMQDLARSREYQQAVETMLRLLVQNIADPRDRRCFYYARQRAQERFRQNIPATLMLRLTTLHRQVLTKMVQTEFADDPGLMREMLDIIDAQINEIELTFTDAYQNARDRQWRASESKYFSLLENASEAILSFRPAEGVIIEANAQTEHLLGRPRSQVTGSSFLDLFAPEHRGQIQWLIERPAGTANVRLEDISVLRSDGLHVPVSLSCTWLEVADNAVVQAIMRDVTRVRQMQRELQDYAEQLEARVAERTTELQQSEERYRALFLQEQRRARHLSLINEVQKCALVTRDVNTFIRQATRAMQSHFRNCDVNFLLCESLQASVLDGAPGRLGEPGATAATCDALVAVAEAGDQGLCAPTGAHLADSRPLLDAVRSGHPVSVPTVRVEQAADGAADGEAPPDEWLQQLRHGSGVVHPETRSLMCVPLTAEGETLGVVTVQSREAGSLDARDAVALQTAVAIVAAHLHSTRLFQEMHDLSEFNQALISGMLNSLMVADREGRIRIVNERLCQTFQAQPADLVGQPISDVFGEGAMHRYGLDEVLRTVTEEGTPVELQDVQIWRADTSMVCEVRVFRVWFRGAAQAVFLLINVTQRWRKTQQLQLMNEMSRSFLASLDINKVLHAILTCITAGSALGFNRAFLLLRQEGSDVLAGAVALGPSSPEEANRIWYELSQRGSSVQEILAASDAAPPAPLTPLQQRIMQLTVDLNNPCFHVLATAVRERRAIRVAVDELVDGDAKVELEPHRSQCEQARELFTAREVAVAPLVSQERAIGVVLADNLYSGSAIEMDDIQLLETLAQQAALTIENALTYQALQKAQKELVVAERLAAVGEMAARVSHEIRNPLATIGGFARSVLRKPDEPDSVQRKTQVVVDEVERLEELLSDLLDMARPAQLDLQPHSVNEIVEHALLLADSEIKATKVTVERHIAADLLPVLVDRRRLLQALLNTIRNGAQAMEDGGVLHITTRQTAASEHAPPTLEIEVKDSGMGIPRRALKQIFDPFFSTKIRGSGLGLAITRRIILDHGGDIDVFSDEGRGTTFVICLPMRSAARKEAASAPPA